MKGGWVSASPTCLHPMSKALIRPPLAPDASLLKLPRRLSQSLRLALFVTPSLALAAFVSDPRILSEPMLTGPGPDSVHVVWYTDEPGDEHFVTFGAALDEVAPATTRRMSRMLEDTQSNLFPDVAAALDLAGSGVGPGRVVDRGVYRHEALVSGLPVGVRTPYFVTSVFGGESFSSEPYSLQPLPPEGHPLKFLITSDQQSQRMSPATFQKLEETVGIIDYVLFPGDFVSTPHRASEWFDRGNEGAPAFFPSLQGFFQELFPASPFKGGRVLQYAPLFGTIGNHESPGVWDPENMNLGAMDNNPRPRWYAEIRYAQKVEAGELSPPADPDEAEAFRARWIRDFSFEFTQYLEMWNHPGDGPKGEEYYAIKVGDVFLISMFVNRVWRNPNPGRGKFSEAAASLNNPDNWGFGDMFFGERYGVGTEQYAWLVEQLESEAFRNSKYKIVLGHQTPFGAGDNSIPVMAEPIAHISYDDGAGRSGQLVTTYPVTREFWESEIQPLAEAGIITNIYYTYPRDKDVWFNDIEPLLNAHGVQLYATGHSHLWNRLRSPGGLNMIETAHYGNSFGAGYEDEYYRQTRAPWARYPGDPRGGFVVGPDPADYPVSGEPQDRPILFPTVFNPETVLEGEPRPLPFVDANGRLGVFTVLDTGTGLVRSWVYNYLTNGEPVLFDEFSLFNHLARNPEIEAVGPDYVTVSWGSTENVPGRLTLYSGPTGGPIAAMSSPVWNGGYYAHEVTISGLEADERYQLQVDQQGTSAGEVFRTVSLVINEVMANPLTDMNGDGVFSRLQDQFVEIFNDTGRAVDLSGYRLTCGKGVDHVFPAGTVLAHGQAVVVFGGGAPAPIEGALVQTASSGRLGLLATADRITLHSPARKLAAAFGYRRNMPRGASLTLDPDVTGRLDPAVDHRTASSSEGASASPGRLADGSL
jgi:hypothetical protein